MSKKKQFQPPVSKCPKCGGSNLPYDPLYCNDCSWRAKSSAERIAELEAKNKRLLDAMKEIQPLLGSSPRIWDARQIVENALKGDDSE